MSFIPLPYRYHPRRRTKLQLADVILIAALVAFAIICLSGLSTRPQHDLPEKYSGDTQKGVTL